MPNQHDPQDEGERPKLLAIQLVVDLRFGEKSPQRFVGETVAGLPCEGGSQGQEFAQFWCGHFPQRDADFGSTVLKSKSYQVCIVDDPLGCWRGGVSQAHALDQVRCGVGFGLLELLQPFQKGVTVAYVIQPATGWSFHNFAACQKDRTGMGDLQRLESR